MTIESYDVACGDCGKPMTWSRAVKRYICKDCEMAYRLRNNRKRKQRNA